MGLEAGNREAGTVISLRDAAGWAVAVLTCKGDGLGVDFRRRTDRTW